MLAALISRAGPARGQGLPAPASSVNAAQVAAAADSAVLVVFNRPIVEFHAWLGASSPQDRVQLAHRRILSALGAGTTDSVTARAAPEGFVLEIGKRPVFLLIPGDLDPLGESIEVVAAATVARLQSAIDAQREARSLPRLLASIGLAILGTIGYLFVLRLLRRVQRIAKRRVLSRTASTVPRLSIGGHSLFGTEHTRPLLQGAITVLLGVAVLLVTHLWLSFVLTRFPYTRPWGQALGQYFVTLLQRFGLRLVAAIPGLLTVVLTYVVTRFVTRAITAFFAAVEAGRIEMAWVHPDTAQPSRRILVALAWLFALVLAYPYIPGSSSEAFKGVSVFAGLVISLGSTGFVNQAMSGLVLMYSRAFRPGEFLRIGETEGTVVQLGMLSTKVRNRKGELISIPNAVAVAERVVNYSRAGSTGALLVSTSVTIGYDAPWRQVHAMLITAASRTAGLKMEPPPFVLQKSLSDFYVEYELNVQIEVPSQRAFVLSALHANIQDSFNEHGVQILSPHYESQPSTSVFVPKERWHVPPAPPAPPAEPRTSS